MVFALCHGAMLEVLEKTLSPDRIRACELLLNDVENNLQAILAGEIADTPDNPNDKLPDKKFLRHCGTPLSHRYQKEVCSAIRQKLGDEIYQQLRQENQLII
jgi:hypothetical protein